MRASRLMNLVLLLQARGTLTAAQIAAELGVSERTVYRDVTALSGVGVPVYAEQGRAGGYRLVDGYRTRLTGMSPTEAEAVFLLGLPGPARDLGLGDLVTAAHLKVVAALPASARAVQRFHLDVPGWFGDRTVPPVLADLAAAVWTDRAVEIRYRGAARRLLPYGVILKAGVWYLLGRVGDDLRVYRVDRIDALAVTEQAFTRPPDFDLAAAWAVRADAFVRGMLTGTIEVRLHPDGVRALRWAVEPQAVAGMRVTGVDAHGWTRAHLPVESVDVAYDQMLCLGPLVEVLAPAVLRDRMREAATLTAALYR
ncbi:helix-turn-helix transcriptional regulator [Catenuloplanes indicus]|uniref:DNA-binding transcriptional regulator YafY n=1 Tax=Catenuloplanes indicus TaxID=137267 RepID=A0AAE4AV16_9ACTN|nr:putative DNA-binding transcriptional regulator YafY [Catenuloplanes indicus]